MAFEETREQQQMYNYFRSCIYIFLIIEIIMNLPVTADNRVTQFVLDLLARFRVFNSVSGCKVAELICICIVCIGTKAEKSLKFNVRTMVIYPVLAGLTLVGLCFVFHGMSFGFSWLGFPANRLLYAVCSVVGTMLVHQGLDGIAKYYNYKVGEDRFNFENESFQQSETLVSNDYSVYVRADVRSTEQHKGVVYAVGAGHLRYGYVEFSGFQLFCLAIAAHDMAVPSKLVALHGLP